MSAPRTASARSKAKAPKENETHGLQRKLSELVRDLTDDPYKVSELDKRKTTTMGDERDDARDGRGIGYCLPAFCSSANQRRKPGEKCKCDFNPVSRERAGFEVTPFRAVSQSLRRHVGFAGLLTFVIVISR